MYTKCKFYVFRLRDYKQEILHIVIKGFPNPNIPDYVIGKVILANDRAKNTGYYIGYESDLWPLNNNTFKLIETYE